MEQRYRHLVKESPIDFRMTDQESLMVFQMLHVLQQEIPPAPQFLASMVAGTVIDPFRRAGLREAQWDFGQDPGHDTTAS
ncbi:hypothetical protein DBIPINDM_005536 [Mesorhizobium sp. AR02]|nr:hypothetical protein [Mesorhizobium sp. AR02]UVK52188.1 hypothetical protein DBIPINDM_005536 [Mesorhizobium sp. AR02]